MALLNQEITNPIKYVLDFQTQFLSGKGSDERKVLGQFFTGSVIAEYMASLVNKPKSETVRILDAGAGTGILTYSTALKCLELGCHNVHAVLYEIDPTAVSSLQNTLNIIKNIFAEHGAIFTCQIYCQDFILERPDKEIDFSPFDLAVINPPYFKYSVTESPYSKRTSDLFDGDPNIYASFMAVVMACLKNSGQMVAITPRSFTNGLYFKGLRKYLLQQSSLNLIHIFKDRDKVFKNGEVKVLQENIICHFTKGGGDKNIVIRASDCDKNIYINEQREYSPTFIIDPSNDLRLIRIPESNYEATILKMAEKLPTTFQETGYFISTGRVVEHRTREFITANDREGNTAPLFRPHNITPIIATWTGNHKKDVLFRMLENHGKHTIKNSNYVLLKRFSSKDEKRRLVAGVYLSNNFDHQDIGFGNKTNYIGLSGAELPQNEAFGIAAVFNSSFMDKYFRCISGNTQVNATEIRVMKFPSREQISQIGQQIMETELINSNQIDAIVNGVLGITGILQG